MSEMFCYQCEQAMGRCANFQGVCGKDPVTAALQDVIVHQAKGVGYLAREAARAGKTDGALDRYVVEALFTTVTNVNFDPARLLVWVKRGETMRQQALALAACDPAGLPAAARFVPAASQDELLLQAAAIGLRADSADPDVRSAQHLLLFGLKGMAAYVHHADRLGQSDPAVFAFVHEALAELTDPALALKQLLALALACGTANLRAMELLDAGHTTRFGHPEPTPVPTALKKGPAIIVTGHDLLDLEALLIQTQGSGVNIYTHGEMLPAHGYPGLKKYPHLVGHFGTAWQNQQLEFNNLPAAILFTTNCIQQPQDSYRDHVFTTGLVAWPGVAHVEAADFGPVIAKAKALGGLEATEDISLLTGCGRNAVLSLADTVIGAVKSGAIRRFFLVGGCDGARPGRNYYSELVRQIPPDCMVLTLACGKFRFNHMDLGTIGGLPRLLDIGQCNDAYSAVVIAKALAEAFGCSVNELPLSLVISWYEQKAVAILLSLLALGIKGVRLGPTLPAFLTPTVTKILVEQFDLKPIGTPSGDLAAMLG
jgi:hydroxylamine reductase